MFVESKKTSDFVSANQRARRRWDMSGHFGWLDLCILNQTKYPEIIQDEKLTRYFSTNHRETMLSYHLGIAGKYLLISMLYLYVKMVLVGLSVRVYKSIINAMTVSRLKILIKNYERPNESYVIIW